MITPRLEVDLATLEGNIAAVRARVAPAELMLVVKDDAYGHGLAAVVTRAFAAGVRWFGAFDVRDALETRRVAGGNPRIFSWLTVGAEEISLALDADVDLGVGDADFLDDVARTARHAGGIARVHLKIDTGLHRNGIRPEDWTDVLEQARLLQGEGFIRVVGVWSHIAEASTRDDDDARAAFEEAVRAAETAGFALEVRHLAASSASFDRSEFRYDLVRIGAFCYGIRSAQGVSEATLGIRPAASLIARVIHVGDTAVILDVGSLHGLPSTLAGRATLRSPSGSVEVRHVGLTRTMVSPWVGVATGQEVRVFGAGVRSATDLAERIDTVGEEILLRVSPLVPRVFVGAES